MKLNKYVLEKSLQGAEATDKEQWILTFPRGSFFIEKYGTDFKFDDAFYGDIAKAFDEQSLSKPFIDQDHFFNESFGDILAYKIDETGMSFQIKLTDKGVEKIKSREFSYISPAWGDVKDTDGNAFTKLVAISLTNFPAFEGILPKLQTQLELEKGFDGYVVLKKETANNKKERSNMLTNILSLRKDASEESIENAVIALKSDLDSSKVELTKTQTTLTETESKLTDAENKGIELSKELMGIKQTAIQAEAKEEVKKNIELGKLHPSVQDFHIKRYLANKDDYIAEMKLIPDNPTGQISDGGGTADNYAKKMLNKKGYKTFVEYYGKEDLNDKDTVDVFLSRNADLEKGGE